MSSASLAHLEQAQQAAETVAKRWIQTVLRETRFQIMRQKWSAKSCEDYLELEISDVLLGHSDEVCQLVSHHWQNRLREDGQQQMAKWVHDVFSKRTSLRSEEGIQETARVDVDIHESRPSPAYQTSISTSRLPKIRLSSLHGTNDELKFRSQVTDCIGRSEETNLPYDWQLIEDYCQNDLKSRVNTKSRRLQYQVLPKEIPSPEEGDSPEVETVHSHRVQQILSKKKATPRQQTGSRSSATRSPHLSGNPNEEARAPSDHPEAVQWVWADEKEGLENKPILESELLHSDDDPDPPHSVLGALRHLGDHQKMDVLGSIQKVGTGSEPGRGSRVLRRMFRKRLGGLTLLRDERKAPMSKVARVQDRNKKYRLEADVGGSILELNRRLYAFSRLEFSMEDENSP